MGGFSRSSSLRSPEPVPVSAHSGDDRGRKLKVLSLFAGIGGFDLGLERTGGFETVAFCEINEFCRRVLAKHWPDVPCYEDVQALTADRLHADGIAIDVICGGFPCQDLSTSGSKLGLAGARSGLWFEYLRLVRELRPKFIIVENSPELLDRWMGDILGALASLGYDAEWHCIPASAVGAPHRRDRVWIVANATGVGQPQSGRRVHSLRSTPNAYREANYLVDAFQRGALPFVCGGHDGPTGSVDELTALGNAVVPQIVEQIGRAILAAIADTHPKDGDSTQIEAPLVSGGGAQAIAQKS
jgi:DNA (cytosine-5)-methyltransferase 1